jgi:hypothetical protein
VSRNPIRIYLQWIADRACTAGDLVIMTCGGVVGA